MFSGGAAHATLLPHRWLHRRWRQIRDRIRRPGQRRIVKVHDPVDLAGIATVSQHQVICANTAPGGVAILKKRPIQRSVLNAGS